MADDGNFISIAFDTESLGNIAKLAQLGSFIESEMAPTLQKIGDDVAYDAIINTWAVFAHPNGVLADTITAILADPMTIEVGSNSSYAARREFGFSGTDSLGRTFTNDPAKPYLEPALTANEDEILQAMGNTIAEAFVLMGTAS
jgi:hypothetical protein